MNDKENIQISQTDTDRWVVERITSEGGVKHHFPFKVFSGPHAKDRAKAYLEGATEYATANPPGDVYVICDQDFRFGGETMYYGRAVVVSVERSLEKALDFVAQNFESCHATHELKGEMAAWFHNHDKAPFGFITKDQTSAIFVTKRATH